MTTTIDLDPGKLDLLTKKIVEMGDWAADKQKDLHICYKEDASPVTEVDLGISHEIIKTIRELFPEYGIITEEEEVEKSSNPPFVFVLDPIDGTDMYSQGLPSFCVALGILDSSYSPVGAVIYAPRFGRATKDGMLIRLNPGGRPTINGEELKVTGDKDSIWQITASSTLLRFVDFTHYKGKIRMFGSQILQILAPALFMHIAVSVNEPCYIWDYAAAHAVIKSLGMDLYTPDMKPFTYSESFIARKRETRITYGGRKDIVERLLEICPPLDGNESIIHY